jgi:DNA repair exonuclease SbcCD ATPase subunit
MIDTLGDPDQSIADLTIKMSVTSQDLNISQAKLADSEVEQNQLSDKINQLINEHSGLESKFSNLLAKEQTLNGEKSRLETSVKEYTTRKSNIITAARDLVAEIKTLEETQLKLVEFDFNQIDILSEQIISNKEQAAQLNMLIQNDMTRIEKLKKPIPKDGECEGCRQPITEEHRKICQAKLDEELLQRQKNIQNCKKTLVDLTTQNTVHQQEINKLNLSRQHLESVNTKIATKKKETSDKRTQHEEYKVLLEKFTTELADKNRQLEQVAEDLAKSSIDEAKVLRKKITQEKENLLTLTTKATSFHKEIAHLTGAFAVFQHDLNKRIEDRRKKVDYTKLLGELNAKIEMYPSVIQAFSSTGIPNLIIQNVLDDLQSEANTLLAQLKPGIQLSFFVEKTKGDGTESDTLDINYSVNGKKRYYEQLSGAMKLAVTFSLKLGLSFLLQKMAGVDIKFLLLDEIDQSLDKASVDSFADIVKFFQKDFTMLVITHNDRLKDKFSHAILVEQDINMVSRARVVSTW